MALPFCGELKKKKKEGFEARLITRYIINVIETSQFNHKHMYKSNADNEGNSITTNDRKNAIPDSYS